MKRIRDYLSVRPPLLALLLLFPIGFLLYCIELWNHTAVLSGVAAYLLTVVAFVVLGRRQGQWCATTQIGVAVALGLAVVILVHLMQVQHEGARVAIDCSVKNSLSGGKSMLQPNGKLPCVAEGSATGAMSASSQQSGGPFDVLNSLAAVLAVTLAVLTLVAQKSASEARHEAEKAQQMLLGAWDTRISGVLGRLALECQRLHEGAIDQAGQYADTIDILPEHSHLHGLWSELLGALNILLVDLLHAIDDDRVDELTVQCERIDAYAKDLGKAHSHQGTTESVNLLREQSSAYVAPLRRLLRRSLDLLSDTDTVGLGAEHCHQLRQIFMRLNGILRVLD